MSFNTKNNINYLQYDIESRKYIKYSLPQVLLLLTVSLASSRIFAENDTQNWYFDQDALAGSAVIQIDKYNKQATDLAPNIEEGKINVDITLNGTLIEQRHEVLFMKDQQGTLQPCINQTLLNLLQIKSDQLKPLDPTAQCHLFNELFVEKGAAWKYDSKTLTLQLMIPQSFLIRHPRGFISPTEWDTGITALWLQHNSDYSHIKNQTTEYDYFWSSLNTGINLGPWQLRNQSYLRYLKHDDQKSDFDWENNQTWLSRKFAGINSELILGNAYTDANVFDSMAFTGIKLATDKQMWPTSLLGFAPSVRGVASTTSQVIIKQNNQTVYEITVPPGPFVINDLPDTNNRGDITVDVVGSNGVVDSFLVPYSHLPSSMRPGLYAYSASLGEVRNLSKINAKFAEATLQAGLNNQLTINSGIRVADDYVALLVGNVWSSPFGAVGFNSTWSSADIPNQNRLNGWRAELNYSKVFETGTNLMLAAYRFSTQNFRDLQDVLGQREASEYGTTYSSYSLRQRNRLSLSLNQSLGQFGNVSVVASRADYYDNQSSQSQFQINYSKAWKGVSFNLGVTRQLSKYVNQYAYLENPSLNDYTSANNMNETSYFASVSFPLDWRKSSSNVTASITHGKDITNSNIGISGVTGKNNLISWSVNASQNNYSDSNNSSSRSNYFNGTLQQNTRIGAWRAMYSQDNQHNQQYNLGLSGSLLVHRGGITLGPWSNGTLALIEAKGAKGAVVENGQGAIIDHFGYALLPNLMPYRYNYVGLNISDMPLTTELKNTSQRVVPYGGAFVKVKFDTVQGHAALISGQLENGQNLPMGAEVLDKDGKTLGMVGQGGQFYVHLKQSQGDLKVQIAEGQYCHMPYHFSTTKANTTLTQIDLTCRIGH